MPHKPCVVCGQLGEGWHFGSYVCRPCASFFRRTIAENKSYDCRQNNQCEINRESRNCCRACRLKKCVSCGMKCPPKSSEMAVTSSPSVSDPHINISSENLNIKLQPSLWKIKDFIKIYYNSLKSIQASENPATCFSSNESIAIDQETYRRMEKISLSIMELNLNSHFPFFGDSSEQFKTDVLEVINFRLMCLTKMIITLQVFPHDDTKAAGGFGYHVDINNPEAFFSNKDHGMYGYFGDAIKKIRDVVRKYVNHDLKELDIGVAVVMILLSQVIQMDPMNEEAKSFKTNLISEYHNYVTSIYGMEKGVQRYTDLFLLLNDSAELCHQIREGLILFGVFGAEQNTSLLEIYSPRGKFLNKHM